MTEQKQGESLHRTLKVRHLNMIALGGAIGTGLFFASGNSISSSGPGGAMVAYTVMGLLVYFLMTSLGEMATLIPLSGSFETYASKFVDPAFGFAMGWNYYFSWAITVAFEVVVGALVIQYWLPDTPTWIWSICFLVILFVLNFMSARAYAESEFWFSSIKVATVVIFLGIGLLMIIGVMDGHDAGFSNLTLVDPVTGESAPFVGGGIAIINVFLVAGFSFQGTELIGLTAGESENPEKDIPKAIKSVFWRILIFYIGSIFVISILIPFNDPNLLQSGAENIAYSPFTLVFKTAGMAAAASFMNAVILTSVLSCGNSGLYASSRMLYAMAIEGKAPKAFSKTNKHGVPVAALCLTTGIATVAFLTSFFGQGNIYYLLLNTSSIMGFFAWFGISVCHWRFRKAYVAQGYKLEDLKYKAKWYPLGPIVGMVLCLVVIIGANIWAWPMVAGDGFTWFDFISCYAPIPLFIGLYFGYKIKMHTKIVPLMECDFSVEYKNYSKTEN